MKPVKLAIAIAHAAFDPSRVPGLERLVVDLESQYAEENGPFHLFVAREQSRRGHMAPWLECCAWALRASETFGATHMIFLPDDAILVPRFVRAMTRIIEARPDDLICCLTNHADAPLAALPLEERHPSVAARRQSLIARLHDRKASDRDFLARLAAFDERYRKLLDELTRESPYPFYATPDGSCLFGGVFPMALLREHLAWRESYLQEKANQITANDEGVNLWAISQGRLIYKPLPSPCQHDMTLPSLCGHDGQEAVYGRTSLVFAAPDHDWSSWGRADGKSVRELGLRNADDAERPPAAFLGRTAASLHWDVLFKARGGGKDDQRTVVARNVPGGSYLRGEVTEEIVERVYAVERGAPPRPPSVLKRYEPGKVADIDYPEGVQVFVATPAYAPALHAMTRSREATLRDLHARGIASWVQETGGHSFVPLARQQLVHRFLCSRSTHLLFWDSDIELVDPSALFRMLRTGHPVVGLAYPYRDGTGRVVGNPFRDEHDRAVVKVDADETAVVAELGTGFLLIQREAILRMIASRPDLLHALDQSDEMWASAPCWAIFDSCMLADPRAPWRKRYLTEDFTFCTLWRSIAGEVRVFVPPSVRHWGLAPSEGHAIEAWGLAKPEEGEKKKP